MKRLFAFVVFCLLSGLTFGQIHQQAYVMNGLAENLDAIDLVSGTVSSNVASLGLWPNQIIYHEEGLVVANSGYNNLQVIDPVSFNNEGTVEFGADHNPYYMCVLNDGRVAVSHLLDNSVSLVNLATMQEETSIPVGTGPEGLYQVGSELFVAITNYAGGYQQGYVDVINLTTNQVIDHIEVGTNPQWIGYGHDGNLHVVCTGDYVAEFGMVYVVNPQTHQVVSTVNLGSSPGSWAAMENGVAYLGVSLWGSGGYLMAYNTVTYQVIYNEAAPLNVGGGVMGLVAGEDNRLYICVTQTDQIKVMDSSENIIATYNVGDGPQSIALKPAESAVPENEQAISADQFQLGQNYPNPFNGMTNIPYSISDRVQGAFLAVYNVHGQRVRRFVVSGKGLVNWDGKNHQGIPVAAGTYLVRLSGADDHQAIKIIYLP